MSDYHILTADKYGNSFQVVMHFPVPDQTNEASVNYRTAIVQWQGGAPIQSILTDIGAEQTLLDAGEIYEQSYNFHSNPGENQATKQAQLDAMWDEKRIEVQAELVKILSYWGFNRDIP
ncbi:hypothetical protein KA005_65005 [bacterium]|nr:hypothetical protein [bacterium]